MRVAVVGMVQCHSRVMDVNGNLDMAEREIRTAAAAGANILCLPELFATGYDLELCTRQQLAATAEPTDGSGTVGRRFSALARELQIYLVAGLVLQGPGGVYNGALFWNDDGTVQGWYAKNHLFGREKEYFLPGDGYRVFQTRYGTVGVIICYDNNFPESARINALMGAELILNPCAWRMQERDIYALMTASHACENEVFFGACNLYYESQSLHLFGASRIVNPRGQVIRESGAAGTDTVLAAIDLDEVAHQRAQLPMLQDRREELYGILCGKGTE